MDPVQQVVDATMASREVARRLLSENHNDVKAAIQAFRRPKGRVSGFRDLREQNQGDRVFTGGEKSGLAVQNPGSDSKRGIVGEIIDKAMQQGPPEAPETDPYAQTTGFRLGQQDEPTQQFPSHRPPEHVQRTLTFWSNGFSIDDGPLHSFDDPMTQTYLDRINSGNAPLDLMNIEHNQLVDLRLEERSGEEYKSRKKAPKFSGGGQRLGTENAGLVNDEPPAEPIPASATTPAASSTTAVASSSSSSAPAAPTGTGDAVVQIRLADGSVRKVRVESEGPVQQLYDLIGPAQREYVLQTPMPPKTVEKDQSVKEAGLKNAVVVQRWV